MQINLLNDEKSEEQEISSSRTRVFESEPQLPEEPEIKLSETSIDSFPLEEEEPEIAKYETDDTELSMPPFAPFEPEDTKPPKKKIGILAVIIPLLVVAVAVVYIFVFRARKEQKPSFQPTDLRVTDTSKVAEAPKDDGVLQEGDISTSQPEGLQMGTLTAFERDVLTSTQSGASIISGVNSALPDGATISMLTYHGDQSLTVQGLARTREELNSFYQTFQGAFPAAQMKSDFDRSVVGGQTLQRITIHASGFKPIEPIAAKVDMLDIPQLRSKVDQIAKRAGLDVKGVSGGTRSFTGDQVERTPISIRLMGSQRAGFQFLNDLANANMNLKFSKVMVLSSDLKVLKVGNVDLILYIELVRPS